MRLLAIRLETKDFSQTKEKTRYLLHKCKAKRMFSWATSRMRSVLPYSFWRMVLYAVSYMGQKFRGEIRQIGSSVPGSSEKV